MTHRMFSRNSASSRAIPVSRLQRQINEDPALPVYWGSAKPGMQAGEELPRDVIELCRAKILAHRDAAAQLATELVGLGMHKQDANRYQEPWMYITVLITATEWSNFFRLRCHPAAHPSIVKIAYMMRDAHAASLPVMMHAGIWHRPFLHKGDIALRQCAGPRLSFEQGLKLCVARCARVSYLTHDGEHAPEKDLALADRLAESGHWSPFEHVAEALEDPAERVGNFLGWRQYRADVDPDYLQATR